jgi:hypothetical protein
MKAEKESRPLPAAPAAWLKEIAAAYLDVEEAIPFGPMAGVTITKKDLFHCICCLIFSAYYTIVMTGGDLP